jgi:glycosyltransferase involved in cell wall biosynthesis
MDTLSIIIPHYQTTQHIKLCLRSLRKYSKSKIEVIVVDNNSGDNSLEYLKSLSWIKLIENHTQSLGSKAHAEALDLGVKEATGAWLGFFHSDTIVLRLGWDEYLIQKIKESNAAGLSTLERDINQFEPFSDKCKRTIHGLRKSVKNWFTKGKKEKIMSFCFIIRKDIFLDTGFSFLPATGDVISDLYHEKIKGKHHFVLLKHKELESYLWHTSNVTSILTGQIKDKALLDKFNQKNTLMMKRSEVLEILGSDSLDR